MRYRALPTPRGGLRFSLCIALSLVCLWLFALPAPAQESPLTGTPAQGSNPDSPSSPPDVVTITAPGCTVSEGASITLEDGDGTHALFVDGQQGIEITSTIDQITMVGPNDDYIWNYAVSSSDPGFDAAELVVVTTTNIACDGGNPTQGTPEASASPVASSPPSSAPVSSAPVSAPASNPASAPASTPPSDSGSAPDSAPANDSNLEGQNAPGPDSECPGARVVNTTRGNGDKQSPVFNISGDSFRVTTTLETNSPRFLAFGVTVNREGGAVVTSISRESPGTDSSIVNAGPGGFFLDILAFETDYVVTVEDCPGARPVEPIVRHNGQVGPIDRPEGVIPRTSIRRVPPRTGGPPYLALGVLVLLGVGLIAGRGALRR
jgi:hypothetical protein